MPTYKSLPVTKPSGLVPQSRHLLTRLWARRRLVFMVMILLIGTASAIFGFKFYQAHERQVTSVRAIEKMNIGKKAVEEKDWDAAIAAFQPLVSSREPIFRISALQNLALAFRGKGDRKRALGFLTRAAEDPENRIAPYSRLLIATLQREEGNKEEAMKVYQELLEEASLPGLREEVEKWLDWYEKH